MLKLLLDEHISLAVARGVRRRSHSLVIWSMSEWEQGAFLGQSDAVCLEAAALQSLTLVTYDCKTIPSLLKSWAEQGRHHAGVVLVDEKTIAPGDIGALVRAILELFREDGRRDWTNRMRFLRAPP